MTMKVFSRVMELSVASQENMWLMTQKFKESGYLQLHLEIQLVSTVGCLLIYSSRSKKQG